MFVTSLRFNTLVFYLIIGKISKPFDNFNSDFKRKLKFKQSTKVLKARLFRCEIMHTVNLRLASLFKSPNRQRAT